MAAREIEVTENKRSRSEMPTVWHGRESEGVSGRTKMVIRSCRILEYEYGFKLKVEVLEYQETWDGDLVTTYYSSQVR